jgi:hypothetical protein
MSSPRSGLTLAPSVRPAQWSYLEQMLVRNRPGVNLAMAAYIRTVPPDRGGPSKESITNLESLAHRIKDLGNRSGRE